jgi:CheY-like chemotaxis protein
MKTSYTILYVDDDMDDLLLIGEAFEKYTDHLRVVHAKNGMEGLARLRSMQSKGSLPCLVILDINMPVMNGKELLRSMRQEKAFQNLPVIMFSTSNNPTDRLFAEKLEADYITKPLDYSNLKSLVSDFVSRCKYEVVNTG